MPAFVPTQLGVLLPSDISDLSATGISDGEFAKRVAGTWDGVKAIENAYGNMFPRFAFHAESRNNNLAGGDNSIALTIPSGYKAVAYKSSLGNGTGASKTWQWKITRDAVTYMVSTASAINNGGTNSLSPCVVYPTDALIFNVATGGAGLFAAFNFLLVPDTDALKFTALPLALGDTTLYTVPVGKKAFLLNADMNNWFQPLPSIYYANISGGTRLFKTYIVPNGESAIQVGQSSIATNGGSAPSLGVMQMNAGDVLVANSDGSGAQLATFAVMEFDA